MGRDISRRDFINGMSMTAGLAAAGGVFGASRAQAQQAGGAGGADYPPARTGVRGSHEGTDTVAHAIVDGAAPDQFGAALETGEVYDLIVVGAGISGLSAAHFFRRDVNPNARILIIDPHDDFGGHAKRNEFSIDGQTIIGYGGSQSIDTPSRYYPSAKQLLVDIGVHVDNFHDYFDRDYYERFAARGRAFHLGAESWGTSHVAIRQPGQAYAEVFAGLPMAPEAVAQLIALHDEPRDWLAGKTQSEKLEILRTRTAGEFLRDFAGIHPDAYRFINRQIAGGSGLNYDQFPALDGAARGYVGLDGLDIDRSQGAWDGLTRTTGDRFWGADEPYIHHFPDGNAGVARLLVRSLIPSAVPGSTMEDVVTAQVDYGALDSAGDVRIRLGGTVARIEHDGDPDEAREVIVHYVQGGQLYRTRAAAVFLGCWNSMIPYIVADLPESRREAAREAVKMPINYTNVLLRNWRPWADKSINNIRFVDNPTWNSASLDFPVSMGDYRFSEGPDHPIVAHFGASFTEPGLPLLEAMRTGRSRMYATSFEDYEREIRADLADVLGDAGFDPARDIAGITVNRWPHGYARYYFLPHDEGFWPEGKESSTPADVLARPFGRLAVGTTDRMYHGFADGAIEAAYRGVNVLAEALARS